MKIAVKDVFRNEPGVVSPPGTAIVRILNGGFDPSLPTDPKDAFVIDFGVIIAFRIISDAAVSFVGIFVVDRLNQISYPFIPGCSGTEITLKPFIVS